MFGQGSRLLNTVITNLAGGEGSSYVNTFGRGVEAFKHNRTNYLINSTRCLMSFVLMTAMQGEHSLLTINRMLLIIDQTLILSLWQ